MREAPGLIPGLEWPFGEGNGNLLQCSCLENPMDGGAWWAMAHGRHKESDMTEQLTLSLLFSVGDRREDSQDIISITWILMIGMVVCSLLPRSPEVEAQGNTSKFTLTLVPNLILTTWDHPQNSAGTAEPCASLRHVGLESKQVHPDQRLVNSLTFYNHACNRETRDQARDSFLTRLRFPKSCTRSQNWLVSFFHQDANKSTHCLPWK